MDLSKIEAGKMDLNKDQFNILNTVSDVIEMFKGDLKDKNLDIQSYVDGQIPIILGDQARVRQILTNIIGNAVKFSHNGSIVVKATIESMNEELVVLYFDISDLGPGIAKENQKLIFETFGQAGEHTKKSIQGTGLGLSICKMLCQAMNGSIGVYSQEGVGSTFYFTLKLPYVPKSVKNSEKDLLSCKRVLVLSSQDQLCQQLETWGLTAIYKTQAKYLIDYLENKPEDEVVDLIVVDDDKGDLDSITLARKLKEVSRSDKIPMILVGSKDKEGGFDILAKDAGYNSILGRPLNLSRLKNRMTKYLCSEETIYQIESPSTKHEGMYAGEKRRILLVDDNKANRKLGERLIQKSGHDPVLAENGQDALDVLSKISVDLIFMDCQMPKMNGFEATAIIRKLEKEGQRRIPIIALTAGVLEDFREKAKKAGMDDFVEKPITFSRFKVVLDKWLGLAEEPVNDKSA